MDSKWKMICGPLNSFILIAVTATNQDIQAAERRLPSIGNSCTVPFTTTTSDIVLTNSIPPTSVLSTRDGNRQLTTTLPIDSDDITSLRLSSPVTEESSDESDADGKFLSLSLLEFILVVVIVAVVVTAIFVVTGLVCCWQLHMKRLQMINNNNSKCNDNDYNSSLSIKINFFYSNEG